MMAFFPSSRPTIVMCRGGFQGDGVLLTSRDSVDDTKAAQDKHDVLYTFSRHLVIRRRRTRSSTLWSTGRAGIVSDAGQRV